MALKMEKTKVFPISSMKEDSRRIFENKIHWWLMSFQWSGMYLGNAPSDTIHISKQRKSLKRIWWVINTLAVLFLLFYMTFLGYRLHSKTLFTSSWIKSFNVFMWCSDVSLLLMSIMFGLGRGNLHSWCHEVSMYCDEYGLNEKCLVVLKKIPKDVIRTLIINTIVTTVGVVIYELVPSLGQSIYLFPLEMRFLNIFTALVLALIHNTLFNQHGPFVGMCSSLLSHEMNRVNKEISACCEEKKNLSKTTDISTRLEKAIQHHFRICDLIGHFNKCICHCMAVAFLIGLPVSCFALWIIITKVKDTVDVAMTTITIIMFLYPFIANSILGCFVNHKAHKALDYIWKLSGSRLRESSMWDVSQLTARLTGTSIGYTVYGFFTFSMSTVLSIGGCILTYFIVVIQFKPLEQVDCSSECNHTCTLPSWCVNNATV